jgi:SagB-type dehydrogenase family enzyme
MDSNNNPADRLQQSRFFLKDTIRQQIDFRGTQQNRMIPAPPLQKPYPEEATRVDLPAGEAAASQLFTMPVGETILHRQSVRSYNDKSMSLAELSALLWATQGVRHILGPETALRTVPSAGARHAFETYIAVSRIEGLAVGLYRYLPFDAQLIELYADAQIGRKAADACLGQQFVAAAAATFFWTVVPARMEWRYDLAAHKVIAIDVGHVCQNLYLASTAISAGTCAIAAYDQDKCDQLLDVDGDEEFTIYIAPVGKI